MESTKLTFNNRSGHTLSARLEMPINEQPVAYALFAHCLTCTMNLRAAGNICRALTQAGFAVLRFDFTGIGESEGDFAETHMGSDVTDLVDAADYLRVNYAAPQVLIGHSLGGSAVLLAAHDIPSSKAVAVVNAPAEPVAVASHLGLTEELLDEEGRVAVDIGGEPFQITRQFVESLAHAPMEKAIRSLKRALLILHSPVDEVVGVHNAARIFETARHPKSYLSLDRADHLLSDERDSLYAGAMIAAWARKYIEEPRSLDEGEVQQDRVIVRTETGYRTEVVANGHHFIADEPLSLGGSDLGPTPYGYLLGALGACTTITLRMYADRKEWPLEAIVVRLRHEKIHALDCAECEEGQQGKVDRIEREIELVGDLDEEQRARLMDIADKCPVHRTLHSKLVVVSQLVQN